MAIDGFVRTDAHRSFGGLQCVRLYVMLKGDDANRRGEDYCGWPGDFFLLPCGATGSILSALRGEKKFLIGTASTDGSCGRASEKRGSLFLLIADWGTVSISVDLDLFR